MRVAAPLSLTSEERQSLEQWARGHLLLIASSSVLDRPEGRRRSPKQTDRLRNSEFRPTLVLSGATGSTTSDSMASSEMPLGPGAPLRSRTPRFGPSSTIRCTPSLRTPLTGPLGPWPPSSGSAPTSFTRSGELDVQPHRLEHYKLSTDKHFEEKLRDIVGPLPQSPRARPRAERGREDPDPSPGSNPIDPPYPRGDSRAPDPRLSAERHHRSVRRPRHPQWEDRGGVPQAASSEGVLGLPSHHRPDHSSRSSTSTSSSTISPPTARQESSAGWYATLDSTSTSSRPARPG